MKGLGISLRARLIALVLVATVPLVTISFYVAQQLRRLQLAQARAELLRLSAHSTERLRTAVMDAEQLLAALAEIPGVAAGRPADCARVFASLAGPSRQYATFLVLDAGGSLLCHNLASVPGTSFSDRQYYRQVRDGRHFVVGEPLIGRVAHRPVLPLALGLRDADGRLRGVLVATLDLRYLGDELVAASALRKLSFTIWARDGTILYRQQDSDQWIGRRAPQAEIARAVLGQDAQTRIVEATGLSGEPKLYAISGTRAWSDGALAMSIGIPLAQVHADSEAIFHRTRAGFAVVFVLALAAALALAEFGIRRKAAALADASQRLAMGDLAARTRVKPSADELGQVARSFDRMAHAVEIASRTLKLVSEGAQALVHANDETALLNEICRIVVEDGGFRSCWVGYAEHDEAQSIRPVADCRADRRYLESLGLTWAERGPGLGPNGVAIRTAAPVIVRETSSDPVDEAWRERALKRGSAAYAALPLVVDGKVLGQLAISAAEPGRFEASEVEILMELAADLGYGIKALRTRAALDRQTQNLESLVEERTAQLQATNRFLDSVIENIPDMIFVKDAAELRFVRFNRAGEELLGYSRDDFIGRNDYDFFPREEADFFVARDRATLAAGTLTEIPEEPIHTRGRGVRILHTKKIPVAGDDGRPRYLVGISRDITDQREREREILALNATLAKRASELDAANRELESFSYSVSHDLRAPLRHVQGYIELLANAAQGALSEEAQRYLRVISEAAEEMGQLIDDLLAFSRTARAEMQHARVDMNPLVADAIRSLEMSARGRRIEWRIAPIPPVMGDPGLLKRVWANLLGNAVKYTRPRDRAVIHVGATREHNGPLVIFVRDNGVGFDMQYANKLFGVFQRLHRADEFEGTGIGLAMVQRILARHSGRIWAKSAPDRGATFFFTLPEASESRNLTEEQ